MFYLFVYLLIILFVFLFWQKNNILHHTLIVYLASWLFCLLCQVLQLWGTLPYQSLYPTGPIWTGWFPSSEHSYVVPDILFSRSNSCFPSWKYLWLFFVGGALKFTRIFTHSTQQLGNPSLLKMSFPILEIFFCLLCLW